MRATSVVGRSGTRDFFSGGGVRDDNRPGLELVQGVRPSSSLPNTFTTHSRRSRGLGGGSGSRYIRHSPM